MSELLKRILTGIAFLTVMVSCVVLSYWTAFVLFAVIVFLAAREYQWLTTSSDSLIYPTILSLGFLMASLPELALEQRLLTMILAVLMSALLPGTTSERIMRSAGVLIISFSFMLLMQLNTISQEPLALLYFFILVWTNDTMAYVCGKMFGKTPLSPIISPKKTWEGFIGGLLFTALVSFFLWRSVFEAQAWMSVLLGVSISLSSTLGDLFESSLKRKAGVKDSGHLLPGHGGILDRFDGVLLASPVAYVVLLSLNQLFLYLGS